MSGGEDDERLDHVAATLIGCGDSGGLRDGAVLEAHRLDFEGADPVAGGDDDVIRAALVPDVSVLVHAGGVLGMEPFAAECLLALVRQAPIAERVMRVRASA